MTKKDRLEKYLQFKGVKPTAFAAALGISNSHVSEINNRKTNRTLYYAISKNPAFSDCNTDWIDTGNGEMLAREKSDFSISEDVGGYEKKPATAITIHRGASAEAWELLDHFETMTTENKNALLTLARAITGKQPEGK